MIDETPNTNNNDNNTKTMKAIIIVLYDPKNPNKLSGERYVTLCILIAKSIPFSNITLVKTTFTTENNNKKGITNLLLDRIKYHISFKLIFTSLINFKSLIFLILKCLYKFYYNYFHINNNLSV